MNTAVIEKSFREKVCAKVRIVLEGDERFRVFTPFLFEDGDHLAIVLKKQENAWVLSDEGHTYMHLTYDLDEKDLQKGTRQKIIGSALSAFHVADRDGELIAHVAEERFGDALLQLRAGSAQSYGRHLPDARAGEVHFHGGLPVAD